MEQIASKFRPPPGRRGFTIPETKVSIPLVYLGWGARRFGDCPLSAQDNFGFVYAAVLEGCPKVVTEASEVEIPEGSIAIFDELCPMGWSDAPKVQCKILVWIWNEAPTIAELKPEQRGHKVWKLDQRQLPVLEKLHRDCRHEIGVLDDYTASALTGLRHSLDVFIVRSRVGSSSKADRKNRYEIGLHWMHQNLHAVQPVSELAVYLGVSESTLQRIFLKHGGQRPLTVFQSLKADTARRLLEEGDPVKAVAFKLGYKHANDFTRFYTKTFGHPPTHCATSTKE
ncbi:MAG: helix-turn-helix domain-containing protein [Verrucomicrobiota bacterium]